MGRARDLTMGPRRGRPPADPRVVELAALTRAATPDLTRMRELIDTLADDPRSRLGRHFQAWMEARNRYAELTGTVTPGPSSPYLAHLNAPDPGDS